MNSFLGWKREIKLDQSVRPISSLFKTYLFGENFYMNGSKGGKYIISGIIRTQCIAKVD